MRYNTFLGIVLGAMVFFVGTMPGAVYAQESQVTIKVTAIKAAQGQAYVDPALQGVVDELKSTLAYSSFSTIKSYTIDLMVDERDRVVIPNVPDLVVTYSGLDAKGSIKLTIAMGSLLTTDFTLVNNGHIVVGGPSYGDGVLLLLFEAQMN